MLKGRLIILPDLQPVLWLQEEEVMSDVWQWNITGQCWERVHDVLRGEERQQMWILIKAEKEV